tara:strand:- start:7676 stop:9010 length:1335 start_codon:yes stop_codon:yes gene_type:complete
VNPLFLQSPTHKQLLFRSLEEPDDGHDGSQQQRDRVNSSIHKQGTKMQELEQQFDEAMRLLEEGDFVEALEQTRLLLAADDSQHDFWSLEGQIRLALGELQAAERSFNRACEVAPGLARPLLHKARFFNFLERFDEAFRTGEQALQFTEEDEDRRDAYLVQAESHIQLARQKLFEIMQDLEEEAELMEQYSHSHDHSHDHDHDHSHDHLHQLDLLSGDNIITPELKEHLELGLELCEKSLSIDEDIVDAWFLKATALFQLEQYEEAAEAFRRTVELDPSDSEYWSGLGMCLELLEDYDGARSAYAEIFGIETSEDAEGMEFGREEFAEISRHVIQDIESEFLEMFGQPLPPISVETRDFPELELVEEMDDDTPFNPLLYPFRIDQPEDEEELDELHLVLYQRVIEREAETDDADELADHIHDLFLRLFEDILVYVDEEDDIIDA